MVVPYYLYPPLTRSQRFEGVKEMIDGLIFRLEMLEREPTAVTTDVDPEEVKQRKELST